MAPRALTLAEEVASKVDAADSVEDAAEALVDQVARPSVTHAVASATCLATALRAQSATIASPHLNPTHNSPH